MKEFEYTITDELGIHARPAGLLVKKAAEFASTVSVDNGTKKADAKRLMARPCAPKHPRGQCK